MLLDLTSIAVEDRKTGFDLLPKGEYSAFVTNAEIKETKKGGEMISMTLEIQSGEYTNRKLFHNFNIKNDNPKAVEIGMQDLKSFMIAAGFKTFKVQNVTALWNKTVNVMVGVEKGKDGFQDRNKIVGWMPYSETTTTTTTKATKEPPLPF